MVKYKIVFIVELTNYFKGGLYYAATERIKAFIENNPDFEVVILNLSVKKPFLVKFLKILIGRHDEPENNLIDLNSLSCENFWISKLNIITYILSFLRICHKHYSKEYISDSILKHKDKFIGADLICAHYAMGPGEFAYEVHRQTGIPFAVTYHGTDIHTAPFFSEEKRRSCHEILKNASANIFVSEGLSRKALEIFADTNKEFIIYNGIDYSFFKQKNRNEVRDLRSQIGAKGKIVAYAGLLSDTKNVLLLPSIFERIIKYYDGEITFLVIGDGDLMIHLKERIKSLKLTAIFTGRIEKRLMPLYYSAIDVLLLPSKNEGMALVLAEAEACGVKCIGSRVGGIPEVIGEENCFDLGDGFIDNVSRKAIALLADEVRRSKIDPRFNPKTNAIFEGNIYRNIIRGS